jgi:hypothetical protein
MKRNLCGRNPRRDNDHSNRLTKVALRRMTNLRLPDVHGYLVKKLAGRPISLRKETLKRIAGPFRMNSCIVKQREICISVVSSAGKFEPMSDRSE